MSSDRFVRVTECPPGLWFEGKTPFLLCSVRMSDSEAPGHLFAVRTNLADVEKILEEEYRHGAYEYGPEWVKWK